MIDSKRFVRCVTPPIWEGIIFVGVDRMDERLLVYEAIPVEPLRPFIQAIWYMTWDIPTGVELPCIVAPNPCAKLCAGFEMPSKNYSEADFFLGPNDKGFTMKYAGSGSVAGIDFRPGGLFPFIGPEAATWTSKKIIAEAHFSNCPQLPPNGRSAEVVDTWLHELETYLQKRLLDPPPHHMEQIQKVVDIVLSHQDSRAIEEHIEAMPVSKRTLQRIFQNEVGIALKDIVRIARFNKTIRTVNDGTADSLAAVAMESGFFDQPHMLNEFRKLAVGKPSEFKKYW